MPNAVRVYDSENEPIGPNNPLETEVILPPLPSAIRYGRVVIGTGGTAVPLSTTSVPLSVGVYVKGGLGNANTVFVGDENVLANSGYELGAGHEVPITAADLSDIYVNAAVGNDNLYVTYIGG